MPVVRQTAFTAGELSDRLQSRPDLDIYRRGLKRCRNMIPLVEGPLIRRGGFEYVADLPTSTAFRLVTFYYSGSQAYLLVFSDNRIDVYLGSTLKDTITPAYPASSLKFLKWAQVHDIMFLADGCVGSGSGGGYGMKVLKRVSDTNWTLSDYSPPGYTLSPPDSASITSTDNTAETNNPELKRNWHWLATSVDANGNESAPLTGWNDPFLSGSYVLTGTSYMRFTVRRDTSSQEYVRFYRSENRGGPYGFVGEVYLGATTVGNTATWDDFGSPPDYSRQPPRLNDPIYSTSPPRAVGIYQQRLAVGGMDLDSSGGSDGYPPQTVWFSKFQDYYSFEYNEPPDVLAEDAIEAFVVDTKRHEVRNFATLGDMLLCFTDGGVMAFRPPQNGVFGAEDGYDLLKVADIPCACYPQPVQCGDTVVFVGYHGDEVWGVRRGEGGVQVVNLGLFAAHLLDGKRVVAHAWAGTPHKVYWCVLDDGSLLSMTLDLGLGVIAWAKHDFDSLNASAGGYIGDVLGVATVPENAEDALYAIIEYTGGGTTEYLLVRKESESKSTSRVPIHVDLFETFNGRNTGTTTLSYSSATGRITASAPTFSASDVGDLVVFSPDGSWKAFSIDMYISATEVSASPTQGTQYADVSATTDWAFSRTSLSFSAITVQDGVRIASVEDGVTSERTASSGSISLPKAAVDAVAGFAFKSEVVTMDADGADYKSRRKEVRNVELHVRKARGLKYGTDSGEVESDGSVYEGDTYTEDTWSSPRSVSFVWKTHPEEVAGPVNLRPRSKPSYGGRVRVTLETAENLEIVGIARNVVVGV